MKKTGYENENLQRKHINHAELWILWHNIHNIRHLSMNLIYYISRNLEHTHMRKLILLLLLAVTSVGYSQIAVSINPAIGCPNTTHNVSVSITNNMGAGAPAGIPYTITITVKDDATNVLQTFTQTYADGFASGATKTYVVTAIPFAGPMVCVVTANVSVPTFSINQTQNYNYSVANPPVVVIEESSGTLTLSTPANGYSVQYFLDGSSTAINESANGIYTPTTSGSYTAAAYDPASGCISPSVSNAITVTVTGVKDANTIDVSVYPNPMTSAVTIKTVETEELSYDLVDLNGKVVRTAVFSSSTVMNAEGLQAGTYVLTISKKGAKVASYKLVK